MAKKRSPNYPAFSLREATEKIKAAYKDVQKHETDKEALVKIFGYSGLNGKSLRLLGTLASFGLFEGRKELSITQDGESIAVDHAGSKERMEAIEKVALTPQVFSEIIAKYGDTKPSATVLVPYLVKKGFSESAADSVVRTFHDTLEFVNEEKKAYNEATGQGAGDSDDGEDSEDTENKDDIGNGKETKQKRIISVKGMNQDIFTLEEGDVTLQWPKHMSNESYNDFKSWVDLILRKAKRSITTEKADSEEAPKITSV